VLLVNLMVENNIPEPSQLPWWKKTVVYQIYPRSFMDSNGDGIGDLKGIISKLDYLKDLGVETIWFSPFYSSPQADFGYDISDYRGIAPEYGNMETCEVLIKEIHARKMRIVMDMVMNHTSDQHPWFLESKSSRDNPKRDWYIWRDGKEPGGKAPPNNWLAMIGGSGWHYDPNTNQWYWTQFLPFQPDLNYRNPEVKKEMFDTVRFWLKRGVDGFRLDIINAVYEDAEFRDNPFEWRLLPSDESPGMPFHSVKYTINHPDTFQFVKELRSVIEEFGDPSRFLVGEVTGPTKTLRKYCGESNPDGLNLVFLFKSLGAKLNADIFGGLIAEYEEHFPEPFIPTWVFGNHDRFRRISRLGNNMLKAKLNTAFQLTARGVPFIYYGDEIGMPQHKMPVKSSLDAVAQRFAKIPQFVFNIGRSVIHESINRDECRTPMQWNAEPNAGFCPASIKPWLPVTPSYISINVVAGQMEKDSLYQCYRRFLDIRSRYAALHGGSIELLKDPQIPECVLGYKRIAKTEGQKQELFVLLNFSEKTVPVPSPHPTLSLLASTTINSSPIGIDHIMLTPYEGVILAPKYQ
jgi:oligo-1,6-glucosidase/alpha-glucosidase